MTAEYLSLHVSQPLLRLLAVSVIVHFLHCGFLLLVIVLVHLSLDALIVQHRVSQ
jgi:hypothetical protein